MTARLTPLGAAARGALAGVVGTLALDAVGYVKYRVEGGSDPPLAWETSEGLDSWENAPAPAHVGRRVVEGVFQRPLPPTSARTVNLVVHWATGVAWGVQYGIIASSIRHRRFQGPIYGTIVWLSSYVVLPLAGLYKPIWEYDVKSLAKDWAGHVAFGTATAAAFGVIGGSTGPDRG